MDRDNDFGTYLASLSKKREPKPKKGKSKGAKEARRNNSEPIIQRFNLGCQIWSYMQLVQGKDYAQRVLEKEVRKISNGFWIGFIEEERNLRYSTAHRLHHWRAFRFYLECKRTGNTTPATVLKGEKKRRGVQVEAKTMLPRAQPLAISYCSILWTLCRF